MRSAQEPLVVFAHNLIVPEKNRTQISHTIEINIDMALIYLKFVVKFIKFLSTGGANHG